MADPLSRAAARLLTPDGGPKIDFSAPPGAAALTSPDSVSWRVFKNPVSLFVGGITAVILELAEPRVRSGVWDHSSFKAEPLKRLKRTGLAAMVTVYGPRDVAEKMIAGVVRMHGHVTGETPAGVAYQANDPALLDWVQATASFGFIEAYHAYAHALSPAERDAAFAEAAPGARLYGATGAPTSEAQWKRQLALMLPNLEPSEIVFEFLDIMTQTPLLPGPLRLIQKPLVRAAVAITPVEVRAKLGLGEAFALNGVERRLVRLAGAGADKVPIKGSPAVESTRRMGLPDDYLYRRRAA
ncbi:oxygenase MpaB family protein [Caulobacter endophyticus]|uniref:oxygenase MpaB family protein n=1 Tax=Caulobacter endophyticus TaxID=2172652 RepID=UPI0024105B43|nr:oxygenase MpaB family protein [Caulobacter endophyticus]MDG2531214.1 oxygenase MpaB family protein [Caulobacter endophyticus]